MIIKKLHKGLTLLLLFFLSLSITACPGAKKPMTYQYEGGMAIITNESEQALIRSLDIFNTVYKRAQVSTVSELRAMEVSGDPDKVADAKLILSQLGPIDDAIRATQRATVSILNDTVASGEGTALKIAAGNIQVLLAAVQSYINVAENYGLDLPPGLTEALKILEVLA